MEIPNPRYIFNLQFSHYLLFYINLPLSVAFLSLLMLTSHCFLGSISHELFTHVDRNKNVHWVVLKLPKILSLSHLFNASRYCFPFLSRWTQMRRVATLFSEQKYFFSQFRPFFHNYWWILMEDMSFLSFTAVINISVLGCRWKHMVICTRSI